MVSKLWMKLTLVIAVVGGIAALLAYGFISDSRYIYSPLLAKPDPYFTLGLFDGGTLHSNDLLGKAVLVNFWASCACPAVPKRARLKPLSRSTRTEMLVFLGVNIQDKEEDARAFLKEFGITYLYGSD